MFKKSRTGAAARTKVCASAIRIAKSARGVVTAFAGALSSGQLACGWTSPRTLSTFELYHLGIFRASCCEDQGFSGLRNAPTTIGLAHQHGATASADVVIGKIAIPSEILTKPTRLSKLEMEMMRGHAQAGYDILKDVLFPTPVAEIIRQHHERMDGSGYPQGLRGDAILPEARVLAVADVIESMASHRPYRPAVGLDAALNEVVKNRGTLYAPEVVDAAARLINDKGYALPN